MPRLADYDETVGRRDSGSPNPAQTVGPSADDQTAQSLAVCALRCRPDMSTPAIAEDSRRRLRSMKRDPRHNQHPVNRVLIEDATVGERLADQIAAGIGSWRFLIVQTIAVVSWVGLNIVGLVNRWDPYPFILLNLLFSVQAAYTGPVLLLAGNRQAQKDRLTLEHAATEADKADRQNLEILNKIAENTQLTVEILKHLEEQRAEFIKRMEESGMLAPEPAPAQDAGNAPLAPT